MDILIRIFFFLFGVIIGSFLNVVLYRLHTGKSLNGRSHCMSCGKTLVWYELVPLFSYIAQKGRCRGCAASVPIRYFVVELFTGMLFLWMWSLFMSDYISLLLHLLLVTLSVLIIVYDMRHTIIPDELTVLMGVVVCMMLGYLWWMLLLSGVDMVWHVVAGGIVTFFFWGLWFVSKGRWIGLGDAKLALPLGVLVGIEGIFSMVVFSFWIGACISLILMAIGNILKKGKTHLRFFPTPITIKSEVPFAPFLIAGFALVHFLHADTFTVIYALLSHW